MGASIYLCSNRLVYLWAIGQILLAVSILQAFFLLQKFGRGEEIKSPFLNSLGGHISSFFCLVPYNQWRMLNVESISQGPKAIAINKKYFIPLNVYVYSIKNYWNIKKLFGLFPAKNIRWKFIMSMLVMNCFFLVVMPNVHHFWRKFGIGYFLFLVLAERWLIKQESTQSPNPGPAL